MELYLHPVTCSYGVLLSKAQGQATFTLPRTSALCNCYVMVAGLSTDFYNATDSRPVNSTCMGAETRMECAPEGRNRWSTLTFFGVSH
jgi:hypothetical protein